MQKSRDRGSIPGLERFLGEGHVNPLQYSCLENFHGQRSLEGYSPWGCEESDTTEHTHGGNRLEIMRHRILHGRVVRMGCTLPESKKLSKRGSVPKRFQNEIGWK